MTSIAAGIVWPVLVTMVAFSLKSHFPRRYLYAVTGCFWLVSVAVIVATVIRQHNPILGLTASSDSVQVRGLLIDRPYLANLKLFSGRTHLHAAVESDNPEIVITLLKAGADVNAKDLSRVTPLHLAVNAGNTNIAEVLVRMGADVNAAGFRHNGTALHLAARGNRIAIVEFLLANGANPRPLDMLNRTPLQVARYRQFTNIVKLLSQADG